MNIKEAEERLYKLKLGIYFSELEYRAWRVRQGLPVKKIELRFNPNHDPNTGRFTNGNGSGVDKSAESGIIKAGSEGMLRKKSEIKTEPMPKKQFRSIKKAFQRQGGMIQQNDETDKYLIEKNAEGITYDAKTVLLMQNPTRASVFEELIHTAQYRDGKNDGSLKSRLINEIEAQEKLIKNARNYKLTDAEVDQTKKALKKYQEDLNAYNKTNGGD